MRSWTNDLMHPKVVALTFCSKKNRDPRPFEFFQHPCTSRRRCWRCSLNTNKLLSPFEVLRLRVEERLFFPFYGLCDSRGSKFRGDSTFLSAQNEFSNQIRGSWSGNSFVLGFVAPRCSLGSMPVKKANRSAQFLWPSVIFPDITSSTKSRISWNQVFCFFFVSYYAGHLLLPRFLEVFPSWKLLGKPTKQKVEKG